MASLNILLSKCTIAVMAIAIGTGKKMDNTGINIVPSPKPENKVRPEAKNVVAQIQKMYIFDVYKIFI